MIKTGDQITNEILEIIAEMDLISDEEKLNEKKQRKYLDLEEFKEQINNMKVRTRKQEYKRGWNDLKQKILNLLEEQEESK